MSAKLLNNTISKDDERIALRLFIERAKKHEVWRSEVLDREVKKLLRVREKLMELNEKYPDINGLIKAIDKMIRYINRVKKKFEETTSSEIFNLIKNIEEGKYKVRRQRRSIMIRKKYVTLSIAFTKSTIFRLILKKIGGITIKVPRLIMSVSPLQIGILFTDGSIQRNHPVMMSVSIFQVILFMISFPSNIYVAIHSLDIDKDDVKVVWYIAAKDWDQSKLPQIPQNPQDISAEDAIITLFTALIGDGSFIISKRQKKPAIYLFSSKKKWKWDAILKNVENNWHEHEEGSIKYVVTYTSYAVELVRKMLNTIKLKVPILFDVIEAISDYDEKIKQIILMASLEIKRKGRYSVLLPNGNFSVYIDTDGSLKLLRDVKDMETAQKVAEDLAKYYGLNAETDIYIKPEKGKYAKIIIWQSTVFKIMMKDKKVRDSIITVLCRKYEDYKDDAKRRERIIKTLRKMIKNSVLTRETIKDSNCDLQQILGVF